MERQKLMEGLETGGCIVRRLKSEDGRSEELNSSLIESGRKSDRNFERLDKVKIKNSGNTNILSIFSDLFGAKTNNNLKKYNNIRNSLSTHSSCFVILLACVFLLLISCVSIDASPVTNAARQSVLFNLSPSARNIRHLPCVSRRTKQEGICMFAIDCLKANGTHLGTCIDRFYFGSCCQMPEDIPSITDNHIEDNSILGQTFHKPVKGVQHNINKIDNNLNPLPSTSSTQSTSHKTASTTQTVQQTPKPQKTSPTRPFTATQSPQKVSTTSTTKKPSQRPTFLSAKPTFTSQKFGSTSHFTNSTTNQDVKATSTKKPDVTQYTRKPSPSTFTRKPITTGVIVNNTIYTGKLPAKNNTTFEENDTRDKTTAKVPEIKPTRNTTQTVISLITTSSTTTTQKPFHLTSRFTTTQRPKNATQNVVTYGPSTTERIFTTQYIQETRRTTSRIPETTTQSIKLSTFHSVQEEDVKKPTTKKPIITGKPTPSVGPHLPFGTRLPAGSSHKPSYHSNNKTKTPQLTETKPTSTTADTNPPIILTPTRPTHKPIQKPTPSQRPEQPIQQPLNVTERPLVHRPQNSTLSNRRPTIKPTPPFKKPSLPYKPENVTSIEPTKKPTTIIYKPTVETRPSLKPTYVHQKPADETQKPTTSVTFRPSTIYNRRPTTTENIQQDTVTTTRKPDDVTQSQTSSWSPTKRPSVSSTLNVTKDRPTSFSPSATTLADTTVPSSSLSPSSTIFSSTTSRPISSFKPSTITKRPLVKPSSAIVPVKPSTVTTKPFTSSKPTINDIDEVLSQKPTTLFGQKPLTTTTTEKIGLVTWTNYLEPAVTPAPQFNSTLKDETLSTITPQEGWVILQTIAPPNGSISTMPPPNTISPSNKPTHTRPTPTRRPVPSSTTTLDQSTSSNVESTTKIASTATISQTTLKPSTVLLTAKPTEQVTVETTRKPVFEITTRTPIGSINRTTTEKYSNTRPEITIHVTTRPLQKPSITNTTLKPATEFSTFMSVSGGPTTQTSASPGDKNATSQLEATTGSMVIVTESLDNGTTSQTETTLQFTITGEGSNSTTASSSTTPLASSTASTPAFGESFNMSDFKDVCGRRLWPEARVVGGTKANFGRWPWQVSLRQWRTSTYLHKCGAALLSENWAITAAHCVDNVAPSDLLLRLGEHDLASEDEPYGYQERRVQIVASHPQFDPRTFEYDLALLRFYEPVNFQPNILPVCVPTNDEGFVGKTAYVTGWGRLYEDGPLPSILQEVRVPILENEACEQMYRAAGYIEHIPHIFICAGWRKGGFDSCEGDSGGPLVLQRDDNRFQLAGVISWGIGCAEPNQPGVYTRISEFRDWINQILQF